MKIDWTNPILDIEGNDTGLTLKAAAINALLNPLKGDDVLTGEEKIKLYETALSVSRDGDITPEQAAQIRDRVGRAYPPLVVGRVHEMIK